MSRYTTLQTSDLSNYTLHNDNTYIKNNKKLAKPKNLKKLSNKVTFFKVTQFEARIDINFSIRYFYRFGNRLYVIIFGNNENTGSVKRFTYYTSISDGKFWRYCIKTVDDGHIRYDKGINYTSTTFINIHLQNFINSQISKYIIEDREVDECSSDTIVKTNSYLNDRIYTKKHISSNIFFNMFNTNFETSQILLNTYKECLNTLLVNLNRLINANDSALVDKIDIYSNLFCKLRKKRLNLTYEISGETSRRSFFTNIKDIFSDIFIDYFTILYDTKTVIFTNSFTVGSNKHDIIVYSVEIQFKLDHTHYILYYIMYKMMSKSYVNILYIIPKNTHITIYGLDDTYVAAGAFINKIYDYKIYNDKETNITKLAGDKETDVYRFIGDLYNYRFLHSLV